LAFQEGSLCHAGTVPTVDENVVGALRLATDHAPISRRV